MNALLYAINEIKHNIPYEVLHAGMCIDEDEQLYGLSTLEEKINLKVFKKRVLLAANVIGGIETTIPIAGLAPTFTEQMYTVYHVPPDLVMGKEIVSALSLSYLPTAGFIGVSGGFGGNSITYNPTTPMNHMNTATMNVASRIAASYNTSSILSSAHLELVARNTIAVYAHYRALANYGIRVVLENHENLANIQPRSYQSLSKLAVFAVKAYIYNKLIVPLNSGMLTGGQELGVFRSIVESYADAEEGYQTYLREVWGKVAFMNDTQRYNNFISGMLAPDL